MFDFSNLKPEIIAQFWIYFIVSFIGGVLIGWLARFFLLKIEKSTLNAEKKLFEAEKGSFKDYESLKNQYESLLKDLEKNEEYWVYKKNVPESHDVVDPSVLLQNELKKKN